MAARSDGPADPVDDDRWARIVEQLGEVDSAADSTPRRPLDFPVAPGVDSPWTGDAASGRDAVDGPRSWDGSAQYADAEAAVDEAEGFVPPDPGPVLGGDPLLTMAWLAAGGMPVLLLALVVFWRDVPPVLIQAACGVFVLGVAVLLWRMPAGRRGDDDDADGDTGAVV
ncbi:hypothetical protein [Cellulomonas gilvus]|uniref:Uncharacterized protein n=1 Tax=Cellulomonas gilvus (strain ATCC 13127 / NRRL B-14078) TaxID=593907 RepID=F8A3P9_CELGA|nr:hypothetical protein [Cellulomonas gilvus]AEI11952.1 hypothetical protein Celgi_1433 [Cellulomonas gilvus ATCC 13127]